MTLKSYDSWLKGIIIAAIGYVLFTVTSIYLPIIVSVVLTFILNPLVNYFSRLRFWPTKIEIGRGFAVIMTFACAMIIFAVIGTFVFLPFMHEFDKFMIELPAMILRIKEISMTFGQRASLLEMPANINALIEQGIASAAAFSANFVRRAIEVILGFASSIVQLVVVPVLTYYFLKDGLILKEKIIIMFPVNSRSRARQVIEDMGNVISGYIRGQVLISIVIGLIVFGGMYTMEISYPMVLGLLAACTETIPIIGPIVGSVPAIMLAYLISPALALKVIIFYIFIHQVENHIVVPNIMGHSISVHPVVVIISLLIGGQMFGILGMMISVPVAALLKIIIKELWNITER